MVRYSLKIIDIIQETSEAYSIVFKQPLLRKISYKAGQYISLIVIIDGRRYVRPYSLSSSPSVDKDIKITVKRVLNGIVSNFVIDNFQIGDVVEILGPMGDFVCQNEEHKSITYLWGVGSGIAPLYSIMNEILMKQPNSLVHLIYGNKQRRTTIFLDKLKQLKVEFGSRLTITHFFSESNDFDDEPNQSGRVTPSFVTGLLASDDNHITSQHFICGPVGFMEVIKGTLIECDVNPSSIHFEKFQLEINSHDLEQTTASQIKISINEMTFSLYCPKGKNILELALDNDIEIPYSCQTGNCSSCKAQLVKGQLKMVGFDKPRLDLYPDEFLLCCSYAISEKIELKLKIN